MDTVQEVWRAVTAYEGCYEVSDQGRVRSLDRETLHRSGRGWKRRLRGRVMTPTVGSHGYLSVMLSADGAAARRLVHDLVTEAFLGARAPGHVVNHRDGDRLNNRASNLEYVTQSENLVHALTHGTPSAKRLPVSTVLAIVAKHRAGALPVDLIQEYGVDRGTVYDILFGRAWTTVTGLRPRDGRAGRKLRARPARIRQDAS